MEDAIGRPRSDDVRWVFRESTDEDEIVEQKTIRKTRTMTRGVASYVEGREEMCIKTRIKITTNYFVPLTFCFKKRRNGGKTQEREGEERG